MGYWNKEYCDVSVLLGKTLISLENIGDELVFKTTDGETYRMYHEQDCCENVYIEDICGNIADLVGEPITYAEECTNSDLPAKSEWAESYTWTFYKFATCKGWVDIRWYGSSNGYYSESVSFYKVTNE
jgi:hypothetical protein